MNKGIKTIQAFDNKYFRSGDAFQLISKNTGKTEKAMLLYCEDDILTFSTVGFSAGSYETRILRLRIRDLETTELKRLIADEE